MPCIELFKQQSAIYQQQTLEENIPKIAIEAGSTLSWLTFTPYVIGINEFGASAKGEELLDHYGFSSQNVVQYALSIMQAGKK